VSYSTSDICTLQLCCYIAEGLTTSEIEQIVIQAVSPVTASRSRLRTKLGLKEGDSLRDYINMPAYAGMTSLYVIPA